MTLTVATGQAVFYKDHLWQITAIYPHVINLLRHARATSTGPKVGYRRPITATVARDEVTTKATVIEAIEIIEKAAPPCLPDADCECLTCTRYCNLYAMLDAITALEG